MVDGRMILPTSGEVVAALRDAGWLLEQDTDRDLGAGEFHVMQGKAFPDPDDATVPREIDVYGYRQLYRNDELSFSIGLWVLAECKQSSMPYGRIHMIVATLATVKSYIRLRGSMTNLHPETISDPTATP